MRAYLSDVGAYGDHPGLTFAVEVTGNRVVVTVAAPVDFPLTVPGGPATARISASGCAIVDPD